MAVKIGLEPIHFRSTIEPNTFLALNYFLKNVHIFHDIKKAQDLFALGLLTFPFLYRIVPDPKAQGFGLFWLFWF
jgi:hypothetical protein